MLARADQYRRAGEPVCRDAGLRHRCSARLIVDVAQRPLAHSALRASHHVRNETPSRAIIVTGIAAVALPSQSLPRAELPGLDVDDGFISLARDVRLHRPVRVGRGQHCLNILCAITARSRRWLRRLSLGSRALAMLYALVGNLYPVPEGPYGRPFS